MKSIKLAALTLICSTFLITAYSQDSEADKETNKISASIEVLNEFTKMKENIPAELLKITEGIIIIPGMKNAGFVVGGKRGKGIAVIKNADGSWSNPVFITLTGGSFGLQVGVQSVDLLLVFKKRNTLEEIGEGSFTLGGDISATAGPVGRNSTASTDYKFEAEVYSYSRAKGLFAGLSIAGSAIDVDEKANERFYGTESTAKEIFDNEIKSSPEETAPLKQTLQGLATGKK
ncbi:MAG: lipid-binding SYLF domain-containing protein [Bacteroidota bacterium]